MFWEKQKLSFTVTTDKIMQSLWPERYAGPCEEKLKILERVIEQSLNKYKDTLVMNKMSELGHLCCLKQINTCSGFVSVAVTSYQDIMQLKGEGLILAHNSRLECILTGKSMQQGPKAASPITSTVGSREKCTHGCSTSLLANCSGVKGNGPQRAWH